MTNEVLQTIYARRSTRAYKPDRIPLEMLNAALEAGQCAPYAVVDSRHFTVLTDRERIINLNKAAIIEGAKMGGIQREMFLRPGFDGTYGAPAVIIISADKSTVQYDAVCGVAAQNMMIAAQSMGLGSCMAYFPVFAFHGKDEKCWREDLKIPARFTPRTTVLLGYHAENSAPPSGERHRDGVTYL
jgi:nitroreductase